jgi:hypothetical protein
MTRRRATLHRLAVWRKARELTASIPLVPRIKPSDFVKAWEPCNGITPPCVYAKRRARGQAAYAALMARWEAEQQ